MRVFGGLAIIIFFAVWVLYRFYKGDLREHKQAFYVYLGFTLVWTLIYGLIYIQD